MFRLGVTAYTEAIKTGVLSVDREVFSGPGVYSEACALAMARGVWRLSGSDYAVGVTGIAGPGGATEKDPVGTVYIAVVGPEKETVCRLVLGHGSAERGFVRRLASSNALAMVLKDADLFRISR